MALLNYEHFDLYGTSAADLLLRGYTTNGGNFVLGGTARTGVNCFSTTGAAGNRGQLIYTLPSPRSVVGSGVALRLNAPGVTSASAFGLRFSIAGTPGRVRILPNANGGLTVWINTTVQGSTANNLLTVGAWAWVEAKVTSGPGTSGAVEVRVNGAVVLNLTGLSLTANWESVAIGQDNTAGMPGTSADDWIIWDTSGSDNNDFFGDTFILVADPNADTAINNFVPSSGTDRWSVVDERVPSDADFLTANAAGDFQELAAQDLILPASGRIVAVASQLRALKTDAGTSTIRHGIAVGGSSSLSPAVNLSTSALVFSHIAERNPDGNVAWTQAAFQGARLRFERTA